MMGLLLFISFLLHAVSFYGIFHLKQRLKETSEIEAILAAYTEEMKEENDRLLRQIKALRKDTPQTFGETSISGQQEDGIDSSQQQLTLPDDEQPTESEDFMITETDESSVKDGKEKTEESLETKALSLANEGLKQEEIAKKLGRGKGEIELLLRLSKAKENQLKNSQYF